MASKPWACGSDDVQMGCVLAFNTVDGITYSKVDYTHEITLI